MVKTADLKEKLQKFLEKLEEKEIFSYYSEVYNEKEEIEAFQVFVPYEDIDVVTTEHEEELRKLNVVLSPAVEKRILKKYLKKLKEKLSILVGNEIKKLTGKGFAVYLNWTNRNFAVHKYEKGNFKSKTCKRTPFWETENGVWIVGFEDCKKVGEFVKLINNFLDRHFGVTYAVNYHRACGAYDECKREV